MENEKNGAEKKVVGIEFGSQDGLVEYRTKNEDGTVGEWNQTAVKTDNQIAFAKLKEEVESSFGLDEEKYEEVQ